MRHLSDGVLRRLYDEPLSVSEVQRSHYAQCVVCRNGLAEIAESARAAASLMAVPELLSPSSFVLRRLRARLALEAARPGSALLARLAARLRLSKVPAKPALASLVAATMVVGIAATGVAQDLFTVFQPTHMTIVPITKADLQSLPDLGAYGKLLLTNPQAGGRRVANAAAAAQVTGFSIPRVSSLPSGVPPSVTYEVFYRTSGTFTFDGAKAAAAAAAIGKRLPPMPKGMNGSTLVASVGPGVFELYGISSLDQTSVSALKGNVLVVAKVRAPVIQSTGVTVPEMERYLLEQPGISPNLAAQIRAIGNPTTTLPIPVPVEYASSSQVTVQGVQGVFLGDSTGLGGFVIWERGGFVYGVGGTLTQSQVLQIANSIS